MNKSSSFLVFCRMLIFSAYILAGEGGNSPVEKSLAPNGNANNGRSVDLEFISEDIVVYDKNEHILAFKLSNTSGYLKSHWTLQEKERVVVILELSVKNEIPKSISRLPNGFYLIRLPELYERKVYFSDGNKRREIEVKKEFKLNDLKSESLLKPFDPFEGKGIDP